jgi:hypothetical protein
MCLDTEDIFERITCCDKCYFKTTRFELVEIVHGIFNDYAFVQSKGQIKKVSLDRVYDIKEENNDVSVSNR